MTTPKRPTFPKQQQRQAAQDEQRATVLEEINKVRADKHNAAVSDSIAYREAGGRMYTHEEVEADLTAWVESMMLRELLSAPNTIATNHTAEPAVAVHDHNNEEQ